MDSPVNSYIKDLQKDTSSAPTAAAEASPLVSPRTAGEILDDAFRAPLACYPLLLALSALLMVPAFVGLLWLLTQPAESPDTLPLVVAAILAAAFPLCGVGSAACQAVLHQLAEGRDMSMGAALLAGVRRAPGHIAAAGLVQLVATPGIWLAGRSLLALLTDSFSLVQFTAGLLGAAWYGAARWLFASVHPILTAREIGWWEAIAESVRESQQQAGRIMAVLLAEFGLLVLGIVNLHLLLHVGFWVAEHLAGFDLAFASAVLTTSNPVYILALLLFTFLVLTPYGEATSYLLHVDARTRHEGLDLRYRIQRCFPVGSSTSRIVGLLLLGCSLAAPSAAGAVELPLAEVQRARAEVQEIQREVTSTDPYPGGKHWQARLHKIAARLVRDVGSRRERVRWFEAAIEEFTQRPREDALRVLEQLDGRLALLEDSLTPHEGKSLSREEIRQLLPTPAESAQPAKRQSKEKKEEPPESPPVRRDTEFDRVEPRPRGGPPLVQPSSSEGFSTQTWLLLLGVLLPAVAFIYWRTREPFAPAAAVVPPKAGVTALSLDTILTQPDRYTAGVLWQEANDHAAAGRFGEAVHTLYLSVLVLLHRADLIRYERTRTNGEYVFQLRVRKELQSPFAEMTNRFEAHWYGDRPSQAADFAACLQLAEQLAQHVKA